MMTEYLQAREAALIDSRLATALLYGIRTDTDSLRRGVTPADVTAYAFLQTIMDQALLRRIEKPSIPLERAHVFGSALRDVRIDDRVAYAFAGRLDTQEKHILPDIADYCMNLDGVDRAAAAAIIDDDLIVTLRDSSDDEEGVARIARALGERGGSGGGHAMMARAVIPLSQLPEWKNGNEIDALMKIVKRAETAGSQA
jgi:nanoRNase/pAp phosphatase (c-di-AMP/oligoRNAs hydrolase)